MPTKTATRRTAVKAAAPVKKLPPPPPPVKAIAPKAQKPAAAPAAASAAKLEAHGEACSAAHAHAAIPQNGSIVHVEFSTPDLEKGSKLYAQLFGWQFFPFMENEMYFTTQGNWGPCGCLQRGAPAADAKTMLYVNTDNMAGLLAKAQGLGATTTKPRTEIPGGHGYFAHLRMPDGNVFGIHSKN
ncbi:MAG: VOC family protein [Planctomycetes bacterium]|nr:VOC family protein [Planctomycetota bacterium]